MPTFNIFVTTPKSEIPDGFLEQASTFISELLGKSESFVTVRVVPDQIISHGGSTDHCGSVQLMSIGALGEKKPAHSKAIAKFLESTLNINADRFYITFFDLSLND